MAKARSILLVRFEEAEEEGAPAQFQPLGTIAEIISDLGRFNIAPDGDPDTTHLLYGPGIIFTLPMLDKRDEVKQILCSITEDSIAWAVIMRVCREMQWRMMEP